MIPTKADLLYQALTFAAETYGEGSPEFLAAYKAVRADRTARTVHIVAKPLNGPSGP